MSEIKLTDTPLWINNTSVLPGFYIKAVDEFDPRTNQHLIRLTSHDGKNRTIDPEKDPIYIGHLPLFPPEDRMVSAKDHDKTWEDAKPNNYYLDKIDPFFFPLRTDWEGNWMKIMNSKAETKGSDSLVLTTTDASGLPLAESIKSMAVTIHNVRIIYEPPLRYVTGIAYNYHTGLIGIIYQTDTGKPIIDRYKLSESTLEINFRNNHQVAF